MHSRSKSVQIVNENGYDYNSLKMKQAKKVLPVNWQHGI